MGPQGAGHNWRTEHIHTHTHTQRKWVIWFNQLSAITEHLSHHKLIMFVTLWREILEIEIIYLPQWYFQTFSWEVFPCILRLISFNAKLRQYGQRRQWHSTPVLLPGKSYGRRSLVGCSPWGLEVGHNWETSFSLFTFMHWRRKWQPTPVFLPGESQGRGSLVGCRLWGRRESDTTEAT